MFPSKALGAFCVSLLFFVSCKAESFVLGQSLSVPSSSKPFSLEELDGTWERIVPGYGGSTHTFDVASRQYHYVHYVDDLGALTSKGHSSGKTVVVDQYLEDWVVETRGASIRIYGRIEDKDGKPIPGTTAGVDGDCGDDCGVVIVTRETKNSGEVLLFGSTGYSGVSGADEAPSEIAEALKGDSDTIENLKSMSDEAIRKKAFARGNIIRLPS